MIEDLDSDRAAALLINPHGEDAPIRAAMRTDKLFEEGDPEGATVWKWIVKAV